MTNPIPEDAIEAAAKAIWVNDQKDQAWALRVVDDAFSPADDWTDECMGYWYRAEAALTAARPYLGEGLEKAPATEDERREQRVATLAGVSVDELRAVGGMPVSDGGNS